jgi:pyrophosphatase PpaX
MIAEQEKHVQSNKIDTVLFDFDGTIMDPNDLIIRSWQHTFRTLTGADGSTDEIVRSFGELLPHTAARFFPGRDVDEVVRTYRNYHVEIFTEAISVFPGVENMLQTLKNEGYVLGLVTSRLARTTRQGMDKYDLYRYFDALVTADDTEKSKPDPEPVLLSLRMLNKTPEQAVMVGDTLHDIRCARNAGVLAALVSWSLAVPEGERTGADAPDFIVETPEHLPVMLRTHNEK